MKTHKIQSILVLLAFLSSSVSICAQSPDSSGIYSIASVMPSYQGGDEALFEFIHRNTKYPQDALEHMKEGVVQMRVVIDEQGNISTIKVMRGICPSLDGEAQRVISITSGKWICGKIEDKPVKTYKYLKVSFKIDTSTTEWLTAPKPKSTISFIGGDEAFYNFIRTNIQVPVAVLSHPDLWGDVTALVSFNSLNQITEVELLKGPFKDLNEEGVRLLKLSQGKWIRTDSSKMTGNASAIVTILFNETMVDTNDRNKMMTERFVSTAYNSNPIFKRALDNYKSGNYTVAITDLDDCIQKKENFDAALYIRALCYFKVKNHSAACEDLSILKIDNPDKESYFQEIYYRYCSGLDTKNVAKTHSTPHIQRPVFK